MKILVSNVGSTSLKFKLYAMPQEELLCSAKIERVGSQTEAIYHYECPAREVSFKQSGLCIPGYSEGISLFLKSLCDAQQGAISNSSEIGVVGFKTVLSKGYPGVHELNEAVLDGMREYLFMAPAHNAPYLEAISCFHALLPDAVLIGAFETAFHTTIPLERRLYALPYEWYERYGIMRLGYHGASHAYIASTVERRYGKGQRSICCHLGGSSSLCAIEDGKSVDTSFGFSLQTGIPHANRCGDTDPYILPYLQNEGMPEEEILNGMAKQGGLLGLSGISNDLRSIEQAAQEGNWRAKLAIDVFVNAIVKCIGAFYAELGALDNLIFTGGIGENSHRLRSRVCNALTHMGVIVDEGRNHVTGNGIRTISSSNSHVRILVIPANEEIGIARLCYSKLGA